MPAPLDPAAALADIQAAPRDDGRLESIVVRPAPGDRRVLAEGVLDPAVGWSGMAGWTVAAARRPMGPPTRSARSR